MFAVRMKINLLFAHSSSLPRPASLDLGLFTNPSEIRLSRRSYPLRRSQLVRRSRLHGIETINRLSFTRRLPPLSATSSAVVPFSMRHLPRRQSLRLGLNQNLVRLQGPLTAYYQAMARWHSAADRPKGRQNGRFVVSEAPRAARKKYSGERGAKKQRRTGMGGDLIEKPFRSGSLT